MPIPNHCIDCDKVATVTLNNVPYCVECGIKEQQISIDDDIEARTIGVEDGKS
jgi:Zn finger protein HypA/HybF involved in hydrogenase expression